GDGDRARVAAWLARDPEAAADVAAARLPADAAIAIDEAVIRRAVELVEPDSSAGRSAEADVIAFPARRRVYGRPWFTVAGWGSLAAATVVAGWLGFNLGRGFYEFGIGRAGQDLFANELI